MVAFLRQERGGAHIEDAAAAGAGKRLARDQAAQEEKPRGAARLRYPEGMFGTLTFMTLYLWHAHAAKPKRS